MNSSKEAPVGSMGSDMVYDKVEYEEADNVRVSVDITGADG